MRTSEIFSGKEGRCFFQDFSFLTKNFVLFAKSLKFLLLGRHGRTAMTRKGEGTLLLALFAPPGKGRKADSEVTGRSTWANIFTRRQFDGLPFEFCGVGLPGRHELASYGEA